MTMEFTIKDLRLPCNLHGLRDSHTATSSDGMAQLCDGSRVPTQSEINALAKPDYEAAGLELDKLVRVEGKLAKTTEFLEWEWSQRIVDAALGIVEDTDE